MNPTIFDLAKGQDMEDLAILVNTEASLVTELLKRTADNKNKAYCPYSKFRVGATMLTKDKKFIDGVNVENISYGITICAERSCLVSCFSQGYKNEDFHVLAVTTDREEFLTPCGACRQFIAEFPEIKQVILLNNSNKAKVVTVEALIPFVFKTEL